MICAGPMAGNCKGADWCMPSKGWETGTDGKDCTVSCPTNCQMPSEKQCWGGKDENECTMPDFCIPATNGNGNDGSECPGICPVTCGSDEIMCSHWDDNGCQQLDTCMPSTMGKGMDGKTDCAANCPVTCGPEEFSCYGGKDWNGCQMPDFCFPSKGTT